MPDLIKEEKLYLEYVKKSLIKELEYYKNELKEIPRRYTNVLQGDAFLVESLTSTAATTLNRLEKSQSIPYFGRFDFLEKGSLEIAKLYIGKTSIKGEDGELATIDWRTPVCSLYYDSEIGETSYTAPKGLIEGELKLKRQIIIKDGELINVQEIDLVAQDEILQNYLNVNADNKMKNIIASIQKEQHQIIRMPFRDNVIVQGVAGSGKTSVALHRIAYLVYNESKNINSNQFLVIGPNKFFLDYISSLLPDLEVEKISQLTFYDIAQEVINEKFILSELNSTLESYFATGAISPALAYKSSLEYKSVLDSFINDYLLEHVVKDIKIGDYTIATSDMINDELKNIFSTSINSTLDRFQKRLISNIKNNEEEVYNKATSSLYLKIKKLDADSPERLEIYNKIESIRTEVKTGCQKLIKSHFKKIKTKPFALYRTFISNAEKYIPDSVNFDLKDFKKVTRQNISKKILTYEDLPALMYLNLMFLGNEEYKQYRQVVLDEAQDLGLFHFYVIKQLFDNSSFSIFGDLNQSIHSYQSISNWEELNNNIFELSSKIKTLNKSYRTTSEIMLDANQIPDKLGLHKSDSLVRHGKDVEYYDTEELEIAEVIISKLTEHINDNYNSVGIISKTNEEAKEIANVLTRSGIPVNYISGEEDKYLGGICSLTAYNSKGLEFDCVIITDASNYSYSSDNKLDLQLLYVAMTRALHELTVLHNGKITNVLDKCVKKNNNKTYKLVK